jgi:DNA topoisomerase-3
MAQTVQNVTDLCNTIFKFGISHTPEIRKVINNSKVSGHHAIIPTVHLADSDLSTLPNGERSILSLIAVRLICATAPVHQYEAVTITAKCGGTTFSATGSTVKDMGWKQYLRQTDSEDVILPDVSEGQTFTAQAVKTKHFTTPPKPYTEDTLLSAMERAGNADYDEDTEKKGLGTPATRAAVIESLIQNEYAVRDGKKLRATEKGRQLTAVVPDAIKSAKLTAEWESKLQQIEHGDLTEDAFMTEIQQFIRELCGTYGTVDFSGTAAVQSSEAAGKCPHCGKDVIKGKFG